MKYYTFYRESNDFTDILSDTTIKKYFSDITTFSNHLMLGISTENADKIVSILTLKYGDSMKTSLTKDYSPIPGVDYTPRRN